MQSLICIILTILLQGGAGAAAEKLLYSYTVQPTGKDRGKLIFSFKTNPLYDFNKKPPLTIEVGATPGVQWDQTKQLPKDGKPVPGSQYYGRMEPVEFQYSLAASRPVEVKAKVTYFYCSKKDGFCAREIKNLTIPLGPSS